jgi:hemerythrin-like domain-containing protein
MTKITDALVTEHVVFRTLFDYIERALPALETAAEARLLAGLMEALLRRHSDTETNLAYVALDHMLDSRSELDCLHEDHKEIDARLQRVQSTGDCAQARRLLKAALRASRDHFLREERTVFPLIEKVLHDPMLHELGKV